ncbi:MAG: gliding motility protein GldB [Prevotella sp.]|nr:gliding motility protein GldB [Prevotella sp.]
MKQLYYILLLVLFVCMGCQLKLSADDENASSQLMEVVRYDRLEYRYLTTGDFSALQQMNTEFPIETRTLIEDVVKIGDTTDPDINTKFLKFYQDTTLQSLIAAVESEYANTDDLNRQLSSAFTRLKHSLPDIEIPKVYAQISALDQSVVVGNGTIGISLDKYLGENYPLYAKFYSPSQRKQMTREFILPDCLTFYLLSVYPLQRFDSRPQLERDLHMGKIQWMVNQILSRRIFRSRYEEAVEAYMKRNPKVSYEELLRMTDFTEFKVTDK